MATIAARENEILESYFPVTLQHSTFRWNETDKLALAPYVDRAIAFESRVAGNLTTGLSERGVLATILTLLVVLLIAGFIGTANGLRNQNR